jgi:hypothetical protein
LASDGSGMDAGGKELPDVPRFSPPEPTPEARAPTSKVCLLSGPVGLDLKFEKVPFSSIASVSVCPL